jgi:hypothetical protein
MRRYLSSLRPLACQLVATPAEQRTLVATLVRLIRSRRRALALAPLLRMLPTWGSSKMRLWHRLAQSLSVGSRMPFFDAAARDELRQALQATQAYADARQQRENSLWSPFGRGLDYPALLAEWRRQPPERLLVFHHHDRRGLLPRSWGQWLCAAQAAGWQVVVSSSTLAPELMAQLQAAGLSVALRRNCGLCLGAYKDLCLLLQYDPAVMDRLHALVLCNDSTLPLGEEAALLAQLQAWADGPEADPIPVLSSLTDSAERGCYHLQSYLLHANRALLRHPAWLRFWLAFSTGGSKDDLINSGEIGLSQAVLEAGGDLRPAYPLIEGLLQHGSMAAELERYRIWQPRHVNPSLFAWQSLLAQGFPLVKKHVLFDLVEQEGQPLALAQLSPWIAPARRSLIAADLQQLFVSRYAFTEPDSP